MASKLPRSGSFRRQAVAADDAPAVAGRRLPRDLPCAPAVQLILLPHFFPRLHARHGMLVDGDSAGMHLTAVDLAARIQKEGWSVWELRPAGNAPAGIVAALYVLLAPRVKAAKEH